MNEISREKKLHRYFDDNIQPVINCVLVLISSVLGYLVSFH